ncbi:hypothetical protein DY000_02062466 [Brassica cretica]|uniref:Ubiquitin-like protease family profile domain-containing protein n=1 Tax=Brassica cretica TaxID=69181 RepID=A0ABQ7AS75_BRACR|nr:hypothetical protein DY000_02062466 [Brassica cretica]
MQQRVLTQGEDLWFTFSDQPIWFSLREFDLTTGLRCEEDQTITELQFKIMKKPYLWMLGKNDKFTVRTLYEMFKEKSRSMPTLERLSLGTAIITKAVIMAENPSSKIPRDRLQRYMNYRLPKMAWGKTAYSILMRSVKSLSASSWTGDSYELDSNEFCTTLRLPGRVYEAVETPDNPKAIIHHSKIDYVEKKPYFWMLGKNDKFTVRTLYEMFTEKARSMPTLERLSLGTAIITEAVIIAENPSSKIPRDRLQHYMNYRLPKMAWAINLWAMSLVNVLGKSLGKPCKISSSSYPLCLHWDSTRTPTITEVLELEKINNVEVSTVIGLAEEYKHLVGAIHSDDADFHSVVKLVQQGYKMRRSDWEKGFVHMFVATEDIGQQRKTKDEDAEHGEDLNHSEDEEENKDEEEKTDEEENKDEEYQKDKEQRKDKNHSMSNSEKLDKLIQMVRDLDKRVVVIQNVLGVKVEVSTMIGLAEEYKHLVEATHSDDADFHSVVKLVQQGYKMRRSDWENGFVDMFVATEDIGQQRKTKDEDAEHGEDLNHSEDEEEKKDEEEKTDEEENKDEEEKTDAEENKDGEDKTDEEENKDEEYQKDKEHRKDKDHSMSNSEKLDKLIQMVRDLDKRVVVIQNVLGVKFNDGSPNKEDCENIASSGDRRSAKDYENEEDTIDEEANSGDKNSALDDENEEAICDEEAKSGTEHLREEENIFGENETTQKITQDEDTEKLKSESCLKQTSHVISPTPTFNTPNFDTRVSSPTPTFTSPKFDLLSQESHSGKVAEKYWLGVVVNLEKRSITAFNCAAMKFTDASLVPYDNAYAMALPFMIRNFFKDVSMDTSKLSIKIVSEGFPQVLKIEDSGIYALKLIECHAMRIVDLTKLSEEKIAIIREKLVVDIFSELQ